MAIRARFCALFLFVVATPFVAASDLSDSMQLFFDGRIQQAHENLNYLVSRGTLDARVFYFRGLANHRLGNLEVANADFQKAAVLEIQTGGSGVGQALQRVQGAERLLLEKHRTMARLKTRARRQLVAPRPAIARTVPAPARVEPSLLVATAPRFRLASEVPLREVGSDPYATQRASGMLADEKGPTGPKLVPSANDKDTPVGTGVVQASNTRELDPDNPFADDSGELGADDDIFASDEPASSRQGSVLFGAFRALGRAITPNVNPAQMIPRGMPLPGAGGPRPPAQKPPPGGPRPGPGGEPEEDFPFE